MKLDETKLDGMKLDRTKLDGIQKPVERRV
jgi:hypothetical protein